MELRKMKESEKERKIITGTLLVDTRVQEKARKMFFLRFGWCGS